MSIRPGLLRHARRWNWPGQCDPSFQRGVLATRCYRVPPSDGKPAQVRRAELDERNRNAYFRLLQEDKLLPCKLEHANKIINQFVSNKANNMDPATNVRKLAQHFKLNVIHLPMLAIPMFRIPEMNNEKAPMPPSQNGPVAAALLSACSAAGDVQATLQIIYTCLYSRTIPQASVLIRYFSDQDIEQATARLRLLAEGEPEKAGATGDPNAMALQGKLRELAGDKTEARYLYEKALERYDPNIYRGYPHPMVLPWVTPWHGIVDLEERSPEPSMQVIREALEFGALKADDPTAYFKLANTHNTQSPEWLMYMTKAAASGIVEAMFKLGQHYQQLDAQSPSVAGNSKLRKALNFITSWGKRPIADFGTEWFKAAAIGGYKPAMIELVNVYENDEREEASGQVRKYLESIISTQAHGPLEQWPHLIAEAKQRLAALDKKSQLQGHLP